MKPSSSESRAKHAFAVAREYLTHWAIAGAIIALTGFAPEHWIADLLSHFSIPESLRAGWLLRAFDIRIGLVAVGVAIVGWDVLRRSKLEKQVVPHDGKIETNPLAQTESRTSDNQKNLQSTEAVRLTLPDKPSIAVLPFQNMSGDPEQEYFADGMAEDITTALSRFRHLFVIARNSSFTYKGRAVDVKQVGRELGVRYVLEGSVRRAGKQVRITAQLIDAATGAHLWADRFEGGLQDIFDLQDQVTTSVVGAIAPKLEQAEIDRAKRKPTDSLDAYDYYLRAMASLHQSTKEANNEALRLFYKAIELDPEYASAHGMAAYCYAWRKANGWMIDRESETAEAVRLAFRAVELGKDDADALCRSGFALARVAGDLDNGAAFIDRALAVNTNLATAWGFSGRVRVYRGESDIAIEHLARAMRLSPLDAETYGFQGSTAFAHFFGGRYDEASSWAERALRENQNFLPVCSIAAASNAFTGRLKEAKQAMQRLREIDPALRVSNLKDQFPFRRSEDMAKFTEGLRKAGLPE